MINSGCGPRIKAFAGENVGSGSVKNATFQNFIIQNVDTPLCLDQVGVAMRLRGCPEN
jgi:galacturan 1,4-alpha-galacturonidase